MRIISQNSALKSFMDLSSAMDIFTIIFSEFDITVVNIGLPILTFYAYKKVSPNIVHTHTGRSSIGLKLIPKIVIKIIHRRIPDKLSNVMNDFQIQDLEIFQ